MILSNGQSSIGLWLYSPSSVKYEAGDLLLGKINGVLKLTSVKLNFTSSNSLTFNSAVNLYCEPPIIGAVSLNALLSSLKQAISAFSISGTNLTLLSTTPIVNVSTPGVYSVNRETKGLPYFYTANPSKLSTLSGFCRITTDGNKYYRELFDFGNKMFFAADGDLSTISWYGVTDNSFTTVNTDLIAYMTELDNYVNQLKSDSASLAQRLQYIRSYPVQNGQDLYLFDEGRQDSYILNLRHDESYLSEGFLRKYSIQVATQDSSGTIYDQYGTKLINNFGSYTSLTFDLNSNASIDITAYQGPSGTVYGLWLDSNYNIISNPLIYSSYNSAVSTTLTAPSNAKYIKLTGLTSDPTAKISGTSTNLTKVLDQRGALTPYGITVMRVTLGAEVYLTSVYEILV